MDYQYIAIEAIGWISTALFLISIVAANRIHLHQLGILASLTTGTYAFFHDATAIWVKWVIAFFFHSYMIWSFHKKKVRLTLEVPDQKPSPSISK